MVKKTKGPRRRTRKKLKKGPKDKVTVNRFLEEFKEGEKVLIKIEPSSHKGMPNPKFKGKTGKVVGKRGRAYIIEVKDGNLMKEIVAYPEHLRPVR
ncbi:MAG: 50S ribosomal protein L21e [Candidatus Aenigmarchaeota archaeon]|nr:50S ribosomal protein L21e [Candidatus Aenigmarchaeota archaeon]